MDANFLLPWNTIKHFRQILPMEWYFGGTVEIQTTMTLWFDGPFCEQLNVHLQQMNKRKRIDFLSVCLRYWLDRLKTLGQLWVWVFKCATYQVNPSHGNPQMRRTLFDDYLFKHCSVKYQTFHQVSEKTSHQTHSHQKTTWKAFPMPPRAIKHQLTCPIELTSGSFLIGRRGILVIPRNRLVMDYFAKRGG